MLHLTHRWNFRRVEGHWVQCECYGRGVCPWFHRLTSFWCVFGLGNYLLQSLTALPVFLVDSHIAIMQKLKKKILLHLTFLHLKFVQIYLFWSFSSNASVQLLARHKMCYRRATCSGTIVTSQFQIWDIM